MELSHILDAAAVRMASGITSKKRLFQELGEVAGDVYGLHTQTVAKALSERESLGPTAVGQGIALPHARLPGLNSVTGIFMRLDRPLDFEAVDRQPVDLVFALFAPADSGVDHLRALALVSRTLRNADVCAKLRANAEPTTLHAVLTEIPTSEAA